MGVLSIAKSKLFYVLNIKTGKKAVNFYVIFTRIKINKIIFVKKRKKTQKLLQKT